MRVQVLISFFIFIFLFNFKSRNMHLSDLNSLLLEFVTDFRTVKSQVPVVTSPRALKRPILDFRFSFWTADQKRVFSLYFQISRAEDILSP